MKDGKVKIKIKKQQVSENIEIEEDFLTEDDQDDEDLDMCELWPEHPIFHPDSRLVRIVKASN